MDNILTDRNPFAKDFYLALLARDLPSSLKWQVSILESMPADYIQALYPEQLSGKALAKLWKTLFLKTLESNEPECRIWMTNFVRHGHSSNFWFANKDEEGYNQWHKPPHGRTLRLAHLEDKISWVSPSPHDSTAMHNLPYYFESIILFLTRGSFMHEVNRAILLEPFYELMEFYGIYTFPEEAFVHED